MTHSVSSTPHSAEALRSLAEEADRSETFMINMFMVAIVKLIGLCASFERDILNWQEQTSPIKLIKQPYLFQGSGGCFILYTTDTLCVAAQLLHKTMKCKASLYSLVRHESPLDDFGLVQG